MEHGFCIYEEPFAEDSYSKLQKTADINQERETQALETSLGPTLCYFCILPGTHSGSIWSLALPTEVPAHPEACTPLPLKPSMCFGRAVILSTVLKPAARFAVER